MTSSHTAGSSPRFVRGVLLVLGILALGGYALSGVVFASTPNVVINEFSSSGSGSEWVELYNPTATTIDFSATPWKIQNLTLSGLTPTGTATTTVNTGTLPANGFLAVPVTGLNDGGDVITLFDNADNKVDQVVYGTVTGYTSDVNAPASGQSAGRMPDGGATWQIFSVPTKGTANNANTPACDVNGENVGNTAIQDAVNAASAGATITVCAGTYPENVTIDKSLTLEGAQHGTDARTRSGSESVVDGSFTVAADDVTLDGFTISPANGESAVNMDSGNNPDNSYETIANNIINVADKGAVDYNSSYTTITKNLIHYSSSSTFGIQASNNPFSDITVSDNTFTGTPNQNVNSADINFIGAKSAPQSATTNDKVLVSGNDSEVTGGTFGTLVAATAIKDLKITNNTSTGQSGSNIYIGGGNVNVTITGNTLTSGTRGVKVAQWSSNTGVFGDNTNVEIHDNDLSGNTASSQYGTGGVVVASGSISDSAVNATGNWWGATSGPVDTISGDGSTPDTNPGGTGSAAVGAVEYGTWCSNASCTPVTPPAPVNLAITQNGNTYACGTTINTTGSSPRTTTLTWDLPAGETAIAHKVVPTYPSGSHGTTYSEINARPYEWLAGNIGKGYGAAPHDQGVYSYSVSYEDASGQWSDPATCTLTYDTVRPTLVFTEPAAASTTVDASLPVSVTATDAGGLKNVIVHVYNEATDAYLGACGAGDSSLGGATSDTYTCTLDTSGYADGDYSLRAGAFDLAGNNQTVSLPFIVNHEAPAAPTGLYAKFQYDKTYVVSSGATLNKTASTTGNNLLLGWIAPTGPVTGYHVLVTYPDGTTKVAYQGPNYWSWLVSQENFGSQQGAYTFEVEAVNANGVSNPSAPFVLSYDTQSPTAEFNPTPPTYVNGNFTVSGDAKDNVALKSVFFDVRDPAITSGNSWVAGCVSGSQTTTWITASTSLSTTCTINTASLTEGKTYTLRIHAGDYANYGGGQQQTLIVDRTRPNGTITAPADRSTQTGSFTITGTATDSLSGVDHVNVYVTKLNPDGSFGGYAIDNQPATWDAGSGMFSYDVAGLADGTYTIKADIFDKAGNSHFASPAPTITVQNVAPVYVTTDAPTNISFSDATLNGTNGDADALGHSFWVSTSTFSTSSPNIPAGVYSTPDLGALTAHTGFSALLSSLMTNAVISGGAPGAMPAITADTTYHYVAWSNVGGTWHPGVEQIFTTALAAPAITSPFDGESTTTAGWQDITWTPVSSSHEPVTYTYQASASNATSTDGSFTSPLVTTPGITVTSIPQGTTGDGTYYMHVMATDGAGNTSAWGPAVKVIVDNSGGNGGTTPATPSVTTDPATNLALTDATLEGTIGPVGASNYLFWVSTSTIDTSNPNVLPAGVVRTAAYATSSASSANGLFSVSLSSLTTAGVPQNLAPITPDTTYYYVAWADIGGAWYPGTVEHFSTLPPTHSTTTVTVQIADLATSTTDALAHPGKWFFWDDSANLLNNSLGAFIAGPGIAPLGDGSAEISAPAGMRIALATGALAGTALKDITSLSYSTYRADGSADLDLSLQFDVNSTGTSAPATYEGRLVYEPYRTHALSDDTWQTWNTLDNSTEGGYGNWWFSNGNLANVSGCSDATPCTWAQILKAYPNIGISGGTYLKAGQWNTNNFTGDVDDLVVGVTNGTNATTTVYDFEPTASSGGSGGGTGGGGAGGLVGDLNGDGRVNFVDFALLMAQFGSTGPNLSGDLNYDHTVNAADLAILLAHWTS